MLTEAKAVRGVSGSILGYVTQAENCFLWEMSPLWIWMLYPSYYDDGGWWGTEEKLTDAIERVQYLALKYNAIREVAKR